MDESRRRILVVDDEKAVRKVLSTILSVMGFEVNVASNGKEGLHLFLEKPFDLVMTDLQMPEIDGWDFGRQIKDKSWHTPVVLVTGEEKAGIMERLRESCIDHAIFKPFLLKDIQETVQKALLYKDDLETRRWVQ